MRLLQTPGPSPLRERIDEGAARAGTTVADLLALSARIAVILIVAAVLRTVLHRAVNRVVLRAAARPAVPESLRQRLVDMTPAAAAERRRQRAETIGSLLKSIASIAVFTVAGTTVLGELGVDLGPIIASAGIVGIALGFGAQNLVKDFLNGIFMILEDQYGVGDAIDLGEATGIVEAVGLRVTRLRSVDGTVWHVRNGEVLRVGNMSQGWSRALLDVSVAYGTDVGHAQTVIKRVADEVHRGEPVGSFVLEEPEVWGVESLGADGIAIRLVVKTAPLEQWKVARELRSQLKTAFDAEGIEIPFPQRSLWLRSSADGPASPVTPAPGTGTAAPSAPAASAPGASARAASAPAPSVPPAVTGSTPGGEADVLRADSTPGPAA